MGVCERLISCGQGRVGGRIKGCGTVLNIVVEALCAPQSAPQNSGTLT